jgi:hypothetical protein
MDTDTIIKICIEAGLTIHLGNAGTLLVTPAASITPELRALIRDHKNELLQALNLQAQDHLNDRTTCTQCSYLALGNKCLAYRRARLTTRDLAADFVSLKQRCGGFAPLAQGQSP